MAWFTRSGARIYRWVGDDLEIMSWEKLGAEVRSRRSELGFTQADVTARGGPAVPTLRAIENNRTERMSARLRRALEKALNWAPRSIDATSPAVLLRQ
jgi:hypothetical protein